MTHHIPPIPLVIDQDDTFYGSYPRTEIHTHFCSQTELMIVTMRGQKVQQPRTTNLIREEEFRRLNAPGPGTAGS